MTGVQPSVFAVAMAEFIQPLLAQARPTFIGDDDVARCVPLETQTEQLRFFTGIANGVEDVGDGRRGVLRRDRGRRIAPRFRVRGRACGSARSCIQPWSGHSFTAPASCSTEIAHPRSVRVAARLAVVTIIDSLPLHLNESFGPARVPLDCRTGIQKRACRRLSISSHDVGENSAA